MSEQNKPLFADRFSCGSFLVISSSFFLNTRLALDAWNAFTRRLPVAQLGPHVSQIVYTVLPFLNDQPEKVTSVLEYIIVDNAKTYV